MNIYHVFCNLKEGVSDSDFADRSRAYFEHLKDTGLRTHRVKFIHFELAKGHKEGRRIYLAPCTLISKTFQGDEISYCR